MRRPLAALILLLLPALLARCSPAAEATAGAAEEAALGPVTGTIRGTSVELVAAEFDGELSIFAEKSWGYSPSLLVFLFLDKGDIPAGRTIVVRPGDAMTDSTPHVHYRWRDADGELETDAAIEGYDLRLSFGEPSDGALPGTIEFAVPGEDTRVAGSFVAALR